MTQPWRIGVVFGLCLLIGAGAVAWISIATLRLDRAEAQARRQAQDALGQRKQRIHFVQAPSGCRRNAA